MRIAIIIPARYASSRLPGKPLIKIGNVPMLERVYRVAKKGAESFSGIDIFVATDDERICDFCDEKEIPFILTPPSCPTGSDRVLIAASELIVRPDFIINMQGDTPLTPPSFIESMIAGIKKDPSISVITPCVRLTWSELDRLKEEKKTTPFSGTCVTMTKDMKALWFSKQIIPAIRSETILREKEPFSPIYRHIGLYGYSFDALSRFCSLGQSTYEKLEGLEQLRFLESGIGIQMIVVDYRNRTGMSGIDSKEDVVRAEAILAKEGDFF